MAKLPKEIDQLLVKLENPADIKHIQLQWNEYVAENEKYELSYPQQFGNLVESNRKFGEHKSIPTPAEQLRMFEGLLLAELEDKLHEQDRVNEQLYELEEGSEVTQVTHDVIPELPPPDKFKDFQLSFIDMGFSSKEGITPEEPQNDIDRSQELGISWMKEWQQKREAEKLTEQDKGVTPEQSDKPYDFNVVFLDMDTHEQQPDMEQEKEDMDIELE